jgi:2-oxoglutarate dehydrogenase E1 component
MAVDTRVQVPMPQMGESVTEGVVLEWHVKVGDTVATDDVLVEISTDKVDAEVPSPTSGTVVALLVGEGDTVSVGAPLCEIESGDAPPASDTGSADANGAADAGPAETVEITMPAMGESVSEGTILEWAKAVGDHVETDETIVEISTDKVDAEVPSPASGTITEILAGAGDTVTVGQVLARLATTNGAAASASAAPSEAPARANGGAAAGADGVASAPSDGVNASPVARRIAAAEGIDLGRVTGTGPQGRITKADVLAGENGGPAAAEAHGELIKGSGAMLAQYMEQSREIPTATSFRTMTVTVLDGRRKQLKDGGQRVSFTHLIAYAIARAATDEMPVMTHHFERRDGKPYRIDDGQCNLGIAVDVEKKDGSRTLMVPVIRNAGGLSFREFLDAFNDLIARARDNKLTADDLTGANVSLTNPGGIGTVASVPRLMPDQGTIVATGSIAYPVGLGAIGEVIGAEKVMSMTSTYDHRVIQGAESGRFLKVVEDLLQGESGFYERVFADLGVTLGPVPAPPAPAAAAAATGDVAPVAAPGPPDEELLQAVQAATALVKAYRTHGHQAARLDPLGTEPEGDPALDPAPLNLSDDMMRRIPAKILRIGVPGETLYDALPHLRETYTGTIAYEIEHIASHRQRMWLREKIETGAFRSGLTDDEKKWLLGRLIKVDAFERFMHKAYLGQKQFSIEGLDMTVPMLDSIIQLSAAHGAREVVVGMAHRGRLNVLAHNLGRPYDSIFSEFEGASTLEAVTTIPQGGTGDVKYHHGSQGSYQLENGESILVNLESNPSHLEFVDPVVVGAARAAPTTTGSTNSRWDGLLSRLTRIEPPSASW